ncbi:MAG: redox-sensing transcriptional repressor Rex [Ruminococcaceae bacterium]|nr:redox-sensing transcriptional repressor Rex [Oscillospiraceae bacterium]
MAEKKNNTKLPLRRRKKDSESPVVSGAVIKRLPRYYRYLRQLLAEDIRRISSGELSRMMNVTASQIRQDFNCFGGFGQQGYGYNVKYLYTKIGELLGVTSNLSAIILGAGNLGSALASSPIFERRGIRLMALFDSNPKLVGTMKYGFPVLGLAELEAYVKENNIDIGIITIPRDAAPEMAEKLANYGIRGLWNFTSRELDVTTYGVVTENVHLGDSLMTLCYKISDKNETEG